MTTTRNGEPQEREFVLPRPMRAPVEPYRRRERIIYVRASAREGSGDHSLLELVRGLDRTRYEPHVVLPQAGPDSARYAELGVCVHHVAFRRSCRRDPFRWRIGWIANLSRCARRLNRLLDLLRPDIVHIHGSVEPAVGGISRRYCDAFDARLVWHLGEDDLRPARERLGLLRVVERSADIVLTGSSAIAERLESVEGVRVMRHGLDLRAFGAPQPRRQSNKTAPQPSANDAQRCYAEVLGTE